MKLLFFILLPLYSIGQFHVRVEPLHKGAVNPMWLKNYVVTYTNDNWASKAVVKKQNTYQGYDDNAVAYYTSYFEEPYLKTEAEAVAFAKQFNSLYRIGKYLSDQYSLHLRLTDKFKEESKKLCFGCKDVKYVKAKPTDVY